MERRGYFIKSCFKMPILTPYYGTRPDAARAERDGNYQQSEVRRAPRDQGAQQYLDRCSVAQRGVLPSARAGAAGLDGL